MTQPKLLGSIRKYGWDNHTLEVLENCENKFANERERYWIKRLNCYHYENEKGLNLTPGGDGGLGGRRNLSGKKVYQFNPNTLELIKVWDSAFIAGSSLKVSPNNIYEAITGKKQIYCKGFLWSYSENAPYVRKYAYGVSEKCKEYARKVKDKYKNGELINPQQGLTGSLNKNSKPIMRIETGDTFESVRQSAIFYIQNGELSKSIDSATEYIRTSAAGIVKKRKDFNFVYI